MIQLHDIRYVRVGTRDLAHAKEFATRIVGLEHVRTDASGVYFRGDDRDHTLCYFPGEPGDHVTGFEIRTYEELQAAAAELERAGLPVAEGKPDELDSRRCKAMIRFQDPTGNKIELVWRPATNEGRRFFQTRDAGITDFSHVGLRTTDPVRDEAFWTKVCNARVSDWIGAAPLLRIDPVHHKMALFPSTFAGVQHINHQVAGFDDIMRNYYFMRENGVKIIFGPGRHPTSTAIFLYFEGPDGLVYEYSTGVKKIFDEENYHPRQFPFAPEGFCMWGSKPDIPEFRS